MKSPGALSQRIASLAATHRAIDGFIREETRRPAPDFAHIAALKRQKLSLKDSIAVLSRRAGAPPQGRTA